MPHVNQINLIGAIARELEKQGFPGIIPRQFNAVIEAADLIVAAYGEPYRPAVPASGLDAWLHSDDTGLSSMVMARRLAPLAGIDRPICGPRDPDDATAHPCDPGDFGRCVGLLDAVPELRPHLGAMEQVSPVWSGLIDSWDELEALYREELPKGKAPKLFARLQELGT